MRGFRIGRILGIDVRVDYSWFAVVVLVVWTFSAAVFPSAYPGLRTSTYLLMGVGGALFFFASLLAHELSHSVMARARGIEVEGITLFIFGGLAQTRSEPQRPVDELVIAAVGPLTSIALSVVLWGVAALITALGGPAPLAGVASYLALLNLILAVFNLLPGFPMDGGRIFRALAWKATGDQTRATRWATRAGRVLGWLIIAWGLAQIWLSNPIGGLWLAFIGWFIRTAAVASYRHHLLAESLRRSGTGESMSPEYVIPAERLPPGFADTVAVPVERPAEPAPAATIVLLRDADGGPEVLLLKRHRDSGFVPGAYVFAGGRVDPEDAAPAATARLRGWPPPPSAGYVVAAIREAFEETGILVGAPTASAQASELREALLSGAVGFEQIVERLGGRLDTADVVYFAHWITPEAEPRRYDTRFFLARVPGDAVAAPDPREMDHATWIRPREALRAFQAGRLPMVFPTVRTLESLTPFRSAADALAFFRGKPVRAVRPRLVRTPDGVGIVTGGNDEAGRSA